MRIIADASPLISLAIIDQLKLLTNLFDNIYLPQSVYHEITKAGKPHAETLKQFGDGKAYPAQNRVAVDLLRNDVDLGEAEAIVLALEMGISLLLIDDAKGRRVAKLNGLQPIGTIGVLLQAKNRGMVDSVKPDFERLIQNKIRIGSDLYLQALRLAGEI